MALGRGGGRRGRRREREKEQNLMGFEPGTIFSDPFL